MLKKILIANRSEIACRIIRSAKALNIKTVAIYSEADRVARHVALADEACYLGPSPSRESYLAIDKIIAIAKAANVDAIHPGYGFLAENAEFARRCASEKIIFIGPSADVIALMGMKDAAKQLVQKLKLPVLPGYDGDEQGADFLLKSAEKIGFPVLLKAAAGGGGRGMRIVHKDEEFATALDAAKRESLASFANDKIIIEKYLTAPRHIEVQVAADKNGNVVHLFERDCSVQRRHQKVLEEAPAPRISAVLREKLCSAAVTITRAINYIGVGTFEFLVDKHENFYFMEMNTRLQVEHPITEFITGQDLVAWQFLIAAGETLPVTQAQLQINGHAIEARLCAEDPLQNYLPASGRLDIVEWPENTTHIRTDFGFIAGDNVSIYYDSLLAKIIAWGPDRDSALNYLQKALNKTFLIGIATNRDFLIELIHSKAYKAADLTTNFISQNWQAETKQELPEEILILASLAKLYENYDPNSQNPWQALSSFRVNSNAEEFFYFYNQSQNTKYKISLQRSTEHYLFNNILIPIASIKVSGSKISCQYKERLLQANIFLHDANLHVFCEEKHYTLQLQPIANPDTVKLRAKEQLFAPIPSLIVSVLVKKGDTVKAGDKLMILEAMKMEHTLLAPMAGIITGLHFNQGAQVSEGAELLEISNPDMLKDKHAVTKIS